MWRSFSRGRSTWASVGDEPRVTTVDQRIAVVDGPRNDQHIGLDTTFFKPVHAGRAPAVLLAHGFGGSKDEDAGPGRGARARRVRGADVVGARVRPVRRRDRARLARLRGQGRPAAHRLAGPAARGTARRAGRPARRHHRRVLRRRRSRCSPPDTTTRVDAIAPQITWYDLADSCSRTRPARARRTASSRSCGPASSSTAGGVHSLWTVPAAAVRDVPAGGRAGQPDAGGRRARCGATARPPSPTASRCPR